MNHPRDTATEGTFRADHALKDRYEDRFSRWPFARRIAATLTQRAEPSCLVVGIYGTWGEGKTSVLNFIEQEISADPRFVVVRFNPWLVSSDEALIGSLFATLAEAVDRKLPTAAEKFGSALGTISSYLMLVQKVPVIGGYIPGDAMRTLGEKLSQVGLEEKRARIGAILREAGLRVVVIIDDVDRIEPNEVRLLFKTVRLAADFEYLTYLLAFDPSVVAKALGIALGGTEALGHDFIEKIVQIPVHLPPASWSALRAMALEYVEAALKTAQIILDAAQGTHLGYHFDAFAGRLRTPRHATAYGNALLFALPSLKGEVDPVDLILTEGIRLFFPRLYQELRVNPELMLGHRAYAKSSELEKALAAFMSEALPDTTPEMHERVRRLLLYLFPAMFGIERGLALRQQRSRTQRISSDLYFNRYFRYGVGDDDLADRELNALLARLEDSDAAAAEQSWDCLLSTVRIDVLVEKIRLRIGDLTAFGLARLSLYLARSSDRFPFDGFSPWNFRSPFQSAAVALAALLLHICPPEARSAASVEVMQEISSLAFAALVFELLGKDDADDDVVPPSSAELEMSGRVLEQRFSAEIGPTWIGDKLGKDGLFLLDVWRRLDSQSQRVYVERQIQNAHHAADFVLMFTPTILSRPGPKDGNFEEGAYTTLSRFFGPDLLAVRLTAAFNSGSDSLSQAQEKACREFLSVHAVHCEGADTSTASPPERAPSLSADSARSEEDV